MDRVRSIDYRLAVNAFVFTAFWFLIGAMLLWSPMPGALGIGGEMFAAWLVLFFLALAASGSLLTVASLNTLFPPRPDTPPSSPARSAAPHSAPSTIWAPSSGQRAPSTPGNAQRDG